MSLYVSCAGSWVLDTLITFLQDIDCFTDDSFPSVNCYMNFEVCPSFTCKSLYKIWISYPLILLSWELTYKNISEGMNSTLVDEDDDDKVPAKVDFPFSSHKYISLHFVFSTQGCMCLVVCQNFRRLMRIFICCAYFITKHNE